MKETVNAEQYDSDPNNNPKIKIYLKERKLYLEDKPTVNQSEREVMIQLFLVTASQSLVDIKKNISN